MTENSPIFPERKTKRALKSNAVIVYHSYSCCWPNKVQEIEINNSVTDTHIYTWELVVKKWMLQGYNPRNVAGMLSWFKNGIPAYLQEKIIPLKNFKQNERGSEAFDTVPVKEYK